MARRGGTSARKYEGVIEGLFSAAAGALEGQLIERDDYLRIMILWEDASLHTVEGNPGIREREHLVIEEEGIREVSFSKLPIREIYFDTSSRRV